MSQSASATHALSARQPKRALSLLAIWFIVSTAFALLALLLASPALAQAGAGKYDQLQYQSKWFTDKTSVLEMKKLRNDVLNDAAALGDPAKRNKFVGYYNNLFNSMTDPTQFAEMAERKSSVVKDIATAAKRDNTRVAAGLTTIAFNNCKAVASGNYYPGARINAILMLGELNDSEANASQRQAPVPKKDALPILFAVLQSNNTSDGLKAAALQGIIRHAALSNKRWSQADKDKYASSLLTVVQSDCPPGRDKEAHGWIQMMATEAIIKMENKNGAEKLAEFLLEFPANEDDKISETMLVHAARTAPNLPLPKNYKPKTDLLLRRWATSLHDAIEQEIKRLGYLETKQAGYGGGSYGMEGSGSEMGSYGSDMGSYGSDAGGYGEMGGYGSMGGYGMPGAQTKTPQTPEIILSRRLLNDLMESFHLGLAGNRAAGEAPGNRRGLISGLADANEKEAATKLTTLIDELATSINDTKITVNQKYIDKLKELETKVAVYINPEAAAKEAAPAPVKFFVPGGSDFDAPGFGNPAAPGGPAPAAAPGPAMAPGPGGPGPAAAPGPGPAMAPGPGGPGPGGPAAAPGPAPAVVTPPAGSAAPGQIPLPGSPLDPPMAAPGPNSP